MHIHDILQEKFPVRNSRKQKEAFAEWVTDYAKEQGWTARIVQSGRKKEHANIVIGDPSTAKVIYTAHYDTPRTLFFPNLMMPAAKPLSFLYAFLIVLPYVLLALVTRALALKLGCTENVSNVMMLIVYFCMFIGMFCFGPVNKHNANDNTSGDAVVLSIMAGLSPNAGKETAFILFDNEEKGKLGSKAFARENPLVQKIPWWSIWTAWQTEIIFFLRQKKKWTVMLCISS